MRYVEPIRSIADIERVKRVLLDRYAPKYYCLFVLGINSGLRISDLLALRVEDVLQKDVRRRQVARRLVLSEKKTGKSADFPLNSSARSALSSYLKEHKADSGPLFPSRNGKGQKAFSRVMAYRVLSKAAQLAGIEGRIGTHTLRKTFGYHAHKAGVPITRLMDIFRHSSADITLAYIGITREEIDDIFLGLNL